MATKDYLVKEIHCTNCNYDGKPSIRNRGSYLVLFILLLFIIPGVLYFLYMITGRVLSCPKCGWQHVVRK